MSFGVTNNDYKNILKYYNKPIPKSNKILKIKAEKIMAQKLCKCIKKLEPFNESRSVGICTNTIFNRKGYTRNNFTCTKKQSVKFRKNTTKLNLTKRNILSRKNKFTQTINKIKNCMSEIEQKILMKTNIELVTK